MQAKTVKMSRENARPVLPTLAIDEDQPSKARRTSTRSKHYKKLCTIEQASLTIKAISGYG